MPIFLFLLAPVLALGGGLAILVHQLAKKLAGKQVAILGGQKVGKTTLLHKLSGAKNSEPYSSTVDPAPGTTFSMDLGGKSVEFKVPRDIPGHPGGLVFTDWQDAFTNAAYVFYLFRSDLIAQGDVTEVEMVRNHLSMFKTWMPSGKAKRPRVILIGTWADQDPRHKQDYSKFKQLVAGADPIKIGAVKVNNASLVVGSLVSDRAAARLITSLARSL